jgi:flagellar hook protein FlgE
MDAISAASSGLMAASARFGAASANVIAAAGGSNGDMAAGMVDQMAAKNQFQASAGILKTADKMFKTLLDMTV